MSPAFSLTSDQFFLVALTASWFVGFSMLRRKWNAWRCLGVVLVVLPFARFALNVALSIDLLFQRGIVLAPVPAEVLVSSIVRSMFYNVVVPTIGLLLVFERMPQVQSIGNLRAGLERIGAFVGIPRDRVRRDLLNGQALFAVVSIVYVLSVALLVLALRPVLQANDESHVFDNVTPFLALGLSIVAGVGEEFLFRGVLLRWLSARSPWLVAVLVQATFFGLVHAGYGNLSHVIGPIGFGLLTALVAMRLGLLSAIVIHAELDVAYFVLASNDTAFLALGLLMLAASVAALVATRAEGLKVLFRPLPSWSGKLST